MTATDSTPLRDEELAAIRARADAATRGPWEWQSAWNGQFFWLSGAEDRSVLAAVLDDGSAGGEYEQTIAPDSADGLFVAHARADVPRLLAEIDRLRRENATLQATFSPGAGAPVLCAPTNDATVTHVAGHPVPDRRVVDAIIADLNQRGYSGEDV